MRDYISRARDLLDQIWRDEEVNIISKNHVVNGRKFDLIDISLRGSKEEIQQKYSRSVFYRSNIRQTNTIIENQKSKYSEFVRKGIPNILTLKLEYIHYMRNRHHKISKNSKNIGHIIFQGVSAPLDQQKKVQLIKIEKVTGLSIEVSYNFQFDAWIIGSDNCSILAYCLEDLKVYCRQGYKTVVKAAKIWFDAIGKLNNKQLVGLRKILNGYTAIGKFNQGESKQLLVKFKKELKWFAIVDNYSNQFCINPLRAKKQMQSFGFLFAKIKVISHTGSETFYQSLEDLYLKTCESGIEDEQFGMQGSIVYFVVNNWIKNGTIEQKVVGAAKIQTLEYNFYMKMKEKILAYNSSIKRRDDRGYISILQSYRRQIEKEQKQNMSNAPYPLQYYQQILQRALQLVKSTIITNEHVQNKFQTLLKIIFYATYKRISLKKYGLHMMADLQFANKLKQISFKQYGGLGCRTKIIYLVIGLPGMFKTYLGKQLSNHFLQLGLPFRIISSLNEPSYTQKFIKQISLSQQENNKFIDHIYVDGELDSSTTYLIIKQIKKTQKKDTLLKFILIRDQANTYFTCYDKNVYPFDIKTIVMCYYGQHTHQSNAIGSNIEDKVRNLSIVTQKLKKNANFSQSVGRLNIQENYFPFTQKMKIDRIEQFQTLIRQILKANDGKAEYCKLITMLDQMKNIEFLSQQQMRNQAQYLIKSSYPIIPTIYFSKMSKQQ